MAYFWSGYGDYEVTRSVDDDTVSVAKQVLDKYNIPYSGLAGGPLSGIDIKHQNSISCINMSLVEEAAKGGNFTELIINADGEGEFIEIGQSTANFYDLYYTISGELFDYTTTSVIVTGKKPLPVRTTRAPYNLLGNNKHVWDISSIAQNCYTDKFKTHSIVTFTDPHLYTGTSSYRDGVDNIYELLSPFESVITWLWDIDPGEIPPEATVEYHTGSKVPILLPGGTGTGNWRSANADMGTLYRRKTTSETIGQTDDEALCIGTKTDTPVTCDSNAPVIDLPEELRYRSVSGLKIDNFNSVENVYLIGWQIDKLWSAPKDGTVSKNDDPTEDNSQVHVVISETLPKIKQLTVAEDYAIGYEDGTICIRFANNSHPGDAAKYGSDCEYQLNPDSALSTTSTNGIEVGCVFPLSPSSGFLVEQVLVSVVLSQTPCFEIYDEMGNAQDIATDLEARIFAVTLTDAPAPLAINGVLIDQAEGAMADNDPTTTENLVDTQYEILLTEADSGPSISIDIATLEEEETINLSSRIQEMIEADEGVSATHLFGPKGKPELGQEGSNGGVINSISYSYSDSGTYTITATEGPRLVNGVTSIAGGPRLKATETYSGTGFVTQDEGNNVIFKVSVDGFGSVYAYNATQKFVRVGDRVGVTINNVPIED